MKIIQSFWTGNKNSLTDSWMAFTYIQLSELDY